MRDVTNLVRADAPFGARRRPDGRSGQVLTAVDVVWGRFPGGVTLLPWCISTVWLRVDADRAATVEPATLAFGFRATLVEDPEVDFGPQLDTLDRTLAVARRHAHLLAGRRLDRHLAALDALSTGDRPDIETVLDAWETRDSTIPGFARLLDTTDHPAKGDLDVDLDTDPPTEPTPPGTHAWNALARCLAIALTAARQADLLGWDGIFATQAALAADALGVPDFRARVAPR